MYRFQADSDSAFRDASPKGTIRHCHDVCRWRNGRSRHIRARAGRGNEMTKELALKRGGSFLTEDSIPEDVFTPEDPSEEQRMIRDMTERFVEDEVLPQVEKI